MAYHDPIRTNKPAPVKRPHEPPKILWICRQWDRPSFYDMPKQKQGGYAELCKACEERKNERCVGAVKYLVKP